MANRKMDITLLFKHSVVSERLEDLRKRDGINSIPLGQLSKEILEKTGVNISAQQLSKYENADLHERMNVNNLLALADFYNVSLNYLLGRSESKSNDVTDQYAANKFGFSDKAMKRMASIKKGSYLHTKNKEKSLELVNFILENNEFWLKYELLLLEYYNENKKSIDKENSSAGIDHAGAIRYSLIRLFESLIDESYKYLYTEKPPKPLFI